MQPSDATQVKDIEIANLDLRYSHTRIHRPEAVLSLANSLQRFGQISPVITVPAEHPVYVLIDGYLRVAALKRCGKDTVLTRIWHYTEQDALIQVLARSQARKWDALEQAGLIRELHSRYHVSQARLASVLGRDQSWISRRLALLDALPDEILELVQQGHISSWSATRVLVPMARANQDHAKTLTKSLMKEAICTRDLQEFFRHYQKSNRKTRQNMVQNPVLFLKALRLKEEQKQAKDLGDGPEGRWLRDLKMTGHVLRRLIKQAPAVIYEGQSKLERRRLLTAFEDTKGLFLSLEQDIRRLYGNNQ